MKIKRKCNKCGRITYVCIPEERRKLARRIKKDIKNGEYACYFCNQTDVNLLNSLLGYKLFKAKRRKLQNKRRRNNG